MMLAICLLHNRDSSSVGRNSIKLSQASSNPEARYRYSSSRSSWLHQSRTSGRRRDLPHCLSGHANRFRWSIFSAHNTPIHDSSALILHPDNKWTSVFAKLPVKGRYIYDSNVSSSIIIHTQEKKLYMCTIWCARETDEVTLLKIYSLFHTHAIGFFYFIITI
jgi:hypothetical protein